MQALALLLLHASKLNHPINWFIIMARNEGFVTVDPEGVYFTHSRVRPLFSGCGRRLEETLELLVTGQMELDALPTITVLRGAGGDDNQGILFSLNNRRLWVLKELRKAGKLPGNVVRVRSKLALPRERDRYTAAKCSLTASLMGIATPGCTEEQDEDRDGGGGGDEKKDSSRNHHPSLCINLGDFHVQVQKQVKSLKEKLLAGKERDVQSKIDDWIDAGHLDPNHEKQLWALLTKK